MNIQCNMKIYCISDTHGKHASLELKEADIIIHAGDATCQRDPNLNAPELEAFFNWFSSLNMYKYKIYIPGNHDTSFAKNLVPVPKNITVLCHNEIEIEGCRIFGSPYTPTFGVGWAYNVDRGKIGRLWNQIPDDIDILVTHGPAKGILDLTIDRDTNNPRQCGCGSLLHEIKVKSPKYHVFGHLHDERGIFNAGRLELPLIKTVFINVSVVDLRHELVNHGSIIKL